MKKILIILSLLLLTGCKSKDYISLSYADFNSKLDNKDSFVVIFGSDTCSACAKYKESMKKVMKDYNVDIYYVNIANLSEEDYSKMYSKYVITSTPTTIFIKDGLETSTYDRINYAASYSDIVSNLKKHGMIGE